MLPVATHTYKHHRIALYADDSPESPRAWSFYGEAACLAAVCGSIEADVRSRGRSLCSTQKGESLSLLL
jgi:hypothetical protein